MLLKGRFRQLGGSDDLSLGKVTPLAPKHRHAAPNLHVRKADVVVVDQLLTLNEVCHISVIIDASRIVTCSCSFRGAAADQVKI